MKNLRNKNQPPPETAIQTFLSSSWDKVLAVYNRLADITEVADAIEAGEIEDFLLAEDIDTIGKLNAILTDATLGNFATQAEAEAGVSDDKTMSPLRVAQAIAVLASNIQNNFDAAGPPTINDDASDGYSAGSVWIDTTDVPNEAYRCSDPTVGAAVWLQTTLTADELALVALSGNSDDLVEGATKKLMTVAERSKLAGIESSATQDQTAAEIEAAYNAQVPVASQLEAEAGTGIVVRRWTPQRVAQAINALTIGGLVWSNANSSIPVTKNTGTVFYALSASVTATLPAAPAVGDMLVIVNNDSAPGSPWSVNITAGGSNEIHEKNVTLIPSYSLEPGEQAIMVCYDAGATKKWHIARATANPAEVTGVYLDADASVFPGSMNFINSDVGAITLLFPASPANGDYIGIADVGNNATVNNITINRNGKTIDGAASNFIIDVSGGKVDFVFDAVGNTWEYRHDFSVDDDLTTIDIVDAVGASAQYGLVPYGWRINLGANSFYDGTTPADFGALVRVEAAVGAAMYGYRTASGTVDQEVQAMVALAEQYNVADHGFKFAVEWIPTTTGAGNVKFELSAVGYADGDEITKTFVVGGTVTDACQLSTTKVHVSGLSSSFTFTEAQLPPGRTTHWRFRRLATDPDDTYANDIRIIQVIVYASFMGLNALNGNDF